MSPVADFAQRTPASLQSGATATPTRSPAVPARGWSPTLPDVFSINVDSSRAAPRDAWGMASSRGLFPFSAQGRLEHFCSTPATYPLHIRFYLDSVNIPRPTPFRPPALSVSISFTPTGGTARPVANVADPAPRYPGPGWPLAPAFGERFAAASSGSGALAVTARLADPDTATTVTYTDTIACELVPCA